MKVRTVRCVACGWEHSETLVESVIPAGLMASFSDSERLQEILSEQRDARLVEAALAHAASCAKKPLTEECP